MLDRLSTGAAMELAADGIAVNALAPEGAVATDNAMTVASIDPKRAEPLETMAEATLALCSGDPRILTGRVTTSLSLLVELGRPVWSLDGRALVDGWQPGEIDPGRLVPSYLRAFASPEPRAVIDERSSIRCGRCSRDSPRSVSSTSARGSPAPTAAACSPTRGRRRQGRGARGRPVAFVVGRRWPDRSRRGRRAVPVPPPRRPVGGRQPRRAGDRRAAGDGRRRRRRDADARSTRTGCTTMYPGLVICSITPYGMAGPYAERPVSEFIVQAESGGLVGRGSVHRSRSRRAAARANGCRARSRASRSPPPRCGRSAPATARSSTSRSVRS